MKNGGLSYLKNKLREEWPQKVTVGVLLLSVIWETNIPHKDSLAFDYQPAPSLGMSVYL